MLRRLPLLPTLLVLAAVAVMIRLGFWQIDRMHQKEAMLARFNQAATSTATIALPATEQERLAHLYESATAICARVTGQAMIGGQNRGGTSGWVQVADCLDPAGAPFAVAIGWTERPAVTPWDGGPVRGRIGNAGRGKTRLIADAGQAGLQVISPPDPSNIPNNHWSYAIQWFLFALTALVIYGLALRKRLAGTGAGG